jgi:hypothetical protein
MRPGDLDGKPYARFYRPEMAPLPAGAREALLRGPVAAELLPTLADAPRLLEPGDQPVEDGYGLLPDGTLVVAVRTAMPGATPAMVDWWFGWHGCEPQRYKLWHPRAHLHAQWGDAEPPGVQGRSRYLGRTSYVDEYLGSTLARLAIRFLPPRALRLDEAALADAGEATAVCARAGLSQLPLDAGFLVHHVRRVPGGCEMRSRFWLGGRHVAFRGAGALGARAARLLPRRFGPGRDQGRDLLVHCAEEMAHLASFLPALHAALGDS